MSTSRSCTEERPASPLPLPSFVFDQGLAGWAPRCARARVAVTRMAPAPKKEARGWIEPIGRLFVCSLAQGASPHKERKHSDIEAYGGVLSKRTCFLFYVCAPSVHRSSIPMFEMCAGPTSDRHRPYPITCGELLLHPSLVEGWGSSRSIARLEGQGPRI